MMNKLPKEYNEVITVFEGMGTNSLLDLKSLHRRKFKEANNKEIDFFTNDYK